MHNFGRMHRYATLVIVSLVFIISVPLQSSPADSVQIKNHSAILQKDSLQIKPNPNQKDMDGYVMRVFWVGLILVVFLLLSLNWLKRRQGKGKNFGQNRIRVLARHYIGPKQWIMIVRIDQKKYVLGATEQSINLIADLGEVSEQDESANAEQAALSFGSLLDKFKNPSAKTER